MISFEIIIFSIPIFASSLLGFVVYTKSQNNLSGKIFAIVCLAIVLWAAANYFSLNPIWFESLFWIRLVMFFAVFLQFMFFLFVHIFPQNQLLMPKPLFAILVALAFFTMAASLGPFIFSEVQFQNGNVLPLPGPLMPVFTITIFLFWGLAGYYIIKKYLVAKDIEKIQWRFIMAGFFIMFFLLIGSQFLAVVFFQETKFIKFGPIFTLPFIILAAYAIVKHHLLNIKVVAVELLTALILIVLLLQLLSSETITEAVLQGIILVVIIVLGISLVKSVLKEIKDKERIESLLSDLRKANIELKRLDKVKSEFLSIASHQLRTPLSVIKGYISMIIEGTYGTIPEGVKKPLENVYQSNERLIKLINDLLNISRIESGRSKVNLEKVDLAELVSEVVKELEIEAKRKNLSLEINFPDTSLPKILLDKEKIRQSLLNVVDNGIRYTEKGGVSVSLEPVFQDQKIATIKIVIKDTGIGMSKEEISNIFKSFSRGMAGNRFWTEGTGLGLYTAKKFIEMHQGKIWAESEGKNKGSTFYIELPIK